MDTNNTAELIKPIVGPNTTILSFQNGVENEEILIKHFGKEKVIGALVFIGSQLIEPGVILQAGYSGGCIGELNKEKTTRVINLSQIFQEAGVDIKVSDDILYDMWNKLLWNTAFNSLSVLTLKTVDKLVDENKDELINIMNEVKITANAHGIKIRPDYIEFNLTRSKNLPGFKTSTLQDFERGKPLEIEELVGVIIRKAKEKNISVPHTEKVYNDLKQKLSLVI
jgi:2-dehydropantoate 2-reductase